MTENKNTVDVWTAGALLMWLAIFMTGLFPEIVFIWLRETGYVVTMRALVNSHWFITLACSGFLGWFTFSRCVECDDCMDVAFGKSVQIVVLAVTAFLPIGIERVLIYFFYIIDPFYRYLILSIIAIKALAWLYLVILILRYYLISGHGAFKNIPLIFPSALLPKEENDATAGITNTADAEGAEQ